MKNKPILSSLKALRKSPIVRAEPHRLFHWLEEKGVTVVDLVDIFHI
jgi:hypothetical protein